MTDTIPHLLEPLGDSYVLMSFTSDDAERNWARAHSIGRALDALALTAIVSTYPAYDTVLVEFDALRVDSAGVVQLLAGFARGYSDADEAWLAQTVAYRMPVRFGGDVAEVAAELGLSVPDFIELQSSEPIRIRCRGVGGSLMMSNPSAVPAVGRLASPIIRDTHVGEFNIAGRQCSLGFASGRATIGWRNLGHTPADLSAAVSAATGSAPMLRAGDRLIVEPIPADAWTEHVGRPMTLVEA